MNKRKRVRAIIFHGNGIVLIKRVKKDKQYHVFPGGGIEEGENLDEAIIREVKEELGIKVEPINSLYVMDEQTFILCKYVDGIIGTGEGEEFTVRNAEDNQYIPEIVEMEKIKEINLLEAVKSALLKDIEDNSNLSDMKTRFLTASLT